MTEENCETFVSDCHVRAAVELISHAWDPVVLSALRLGPTRRTDILHRIAGVSDKVLTESLRRSRPVGWSRGPRTAPGATALSTSSPRWGHRSPAVR